ncbi:Alpha/Beta hydrolase protein [Cokeromyces recurvatus]|uniref:Alpha/Beta hydrolase protein n=1 Tax=Cokeromyces recurvatus TaxID=90255 RepID=UPI00221F8041|nr:Alpha/Beta hydrolase protein [Cokeromyces recurvatus]KAI7904316.1 Alpha/Beta hydrolase protein [Cokeromyces recurvatus]
MYLKPTSTFVIPVHPSTEGADVQKLVVDKHEFTSTYSQGAHKKIAFLFSHSNGFHKEAFHPLMKRFLNHLRSLREYDEIDITFISWDARNHGDSARINEGTYLESYRWFDNAMDTKQVIDNMELNINYDQFIGVGHSFGATCMLLCEFFYPNTFNGLCVIEPVMSMFMMDYEIRIQLPVLSSKKRRDEWSSRKECRESFLKSPFFKLLHPEVLDNYVNYGMYETDQGTIKLKCEREQEYHVFRWYQYDTYTAYKSLPSLKIPTHFVYALDSNFLGPDDSNIVNNENKEHISVDFVKGTHMVPNEIPEVIIPEIMKLIERINAARNKSKL